MRRIKTNILLFAALLLFGCAAKPELASPPPLAPVAESGNFSRWIQLGPDGGAQVRAVAEGAGAACPVMALSGGGALRLTLRAAGDEKFPALCSAEIPKGQNVAGLPVINPAPRRILVLGDTGCRVESQVIQNCNDPKAWPFPGLAAAAARLKPELVIHVGDYQYRVAACPAGNAACAGSAYGDDWAAWKQDFFAPAAPLLAAAPWIFVRGNHESCFSMWDGYLRLIGPADFHGACVGHLAPYRVPLGDFALMVMDDADASDTDVEAAHVPVYQAELADAVRPSAAPLWLVMHRPIWAAATGPLGIPAGGNAQIIAAAEKTMIAKPVTLMLAGHLHTFEVINYAHDGRDGIPPPQIVAGNGGDNLLVTPANLIGAAFQGHSGVHVKDGLSVGGFGFLLLTRGTRGWTIDLYDAAGVAEGQCVFTFVSDRVDCPKLPAGK